MDPIDLANHEKIKIVFGESSESTFASLKNFWEKPWLYPVPKSLQYTEIKSKITNETFAVVTKLQYIQEITLIKHLMLQKKIEV